MIASPSGMLDKTLFEAAASGCLPLTSNRNLADRIDGPLLFEEGNVDELANKLEALLTLSHEERAVLMVTPSQLVVENSLTALGHRLSEEIIV